MNKQSFNEFFIQMEHKWLKHWYEKGIVEKYLHKNDSADEHFSFMDGPITANNPMGVHHAWGRTYKDLWQKFHNLLGHRQRFQNGFDCQGLWVEVEVEKELKLKTKKDIENLVPGDKFASIAKFVKLCRERVLKFSAIQTDQSKRLGYFMDWDHSYFTMSDENNYMIWHFLKKCFENGWVYKGQESVPWCPRCETAISQHEMLTEDYKEVVHEAIYFKLPIEGRKDEYLLVWTTTPWTIPANIAVAVDVKLDYSLVQGTSSGKFWIVKDRLPAVFSAKGGSDYGRGKDYKRVVKTVKGNELVGLKYKGPFDDLPAVKKVARDHSDKFHTVISSDEKILPILTTEGTGLVHTAVSAGTEDFALGKKYGLPMIPVILDDASYMDGLGIFSGKNAKKHPELILDNLKQRDEKGENWVFKIERYKHRYPGCWRCKTELVWKVADEWYIAMDKKSVISNQKSDKRTLRQRMIEVAKKIKWMPEFGLDRELDWLKNMHDWLISKKNRYWGLALPIYECKKCKEFEVIGSKEELKERAVKGWDKFEGHTPHKPHIDEVVIKCSSCGEEVKRILDVGNPWLDAGIVPYSTITKNNQGKPLYLSSRQDWQSWFPIDFITESFPGQFKNWFYAMIAMSTVLEDTNPFKTVLGFGTLLGEDGRPMHKSWGNSIAFHEGADEIGVDVMRWMYARQNPADNLLFGYKHANEVRRQFYLLLWNIFKFYRDYSAIDKYEIRHAELDSASQIVIPAEAGISGSRNHRLAGSRKRRDKFGMTNILDRWLLSQLTYTLLNVRKYMDQYNAKNAADLVETFISDFSTWYIRRSRDRVGPSVLNSKDKKSFYDTTHFVLKNVSIIISPFMPFISEEIFTTLTKNTSVHLAFWPSLSSKHDEKLIGDIKIVRAIAEVGHRVRKELKIKVRQPLASVAIGLPKDQSYSDTKNRENYDKLLRDELNVKKIEYASGKSEITVKYDTKITPQLQLEGELRDLMRSIQQKRKELGVQISDPVSIMIPEKFTQFKKTIEKQVNAGKVEIGTELRVEKNI